MVKVRALDVAFVLASVGAAADAIRAQTSPTPARLSQAGRVFDQERKPIVGAQVTLASRGERGGMDEGDVVRVESGANGHFRAQLLPTRDYVVWAAVTREQAVFVSAPVDANGEPLELVVAGDRPAPRNHRLLETKEWRSLGPLRVEFRVLDSPALTIRTAPDDAGDIAMPPLPHLQIDLRVFVGESFVEQRRTLPGGTFVLPPPQRIRVCVTDTQERPLAGATIHLLCKVHNAEDSPFGDRLDVRRELVATTAADGTATILVPRQRDPLVAGSDNLVFVACHEGYTDSISGVMSQPFVDGELVADTRTLKHVLPFHLREQVAMVKPVLANGARPVSVRALRMRELPGHTIPMLDSTLVPVVDGVLHFDSITAGSMHVVEVPSQVPPVVDDERWQRLARPMTMLLPATVLANPAGLDLRTVVGLRLNVLDPSAGPVPRAHVLCCPLDGNAVVEPALAMRARTDRSGRVLLPVVPGRWFVAAAAGDAWQGTAIDVRQGIDVQTLRLQRLDRMRVRTRDAAGAALGGVTFTMQAGIRLDDGSQEEQLLRSIGWEISCWSLPRARSDRDGLAELLFVADVGPGLHVKPNCGDREAGPLLLVACEEPRVVELK